MRRISLSTFRRIGQAEETMMRAAMPRTSLRDPAPLAPHGGRTPVEIIATRGLRSQLVRPLTFRMGEVAGNA